MQNKIVAEKYGVDMSELVFFKDIGIAFTDHYLFVRYYPSKSQIEKRITGYKAAIELVNKMLLIKNKNRFHC